MKKMTPKQKKYLNALLCAAGICVTTTLFFHRDSIAGDANRDQLETLTPSQQTAISHANQLSEAFQCIADNLLPSVVAIESSKRHPTQVGAIRVPDSPMSEIPLDHFKGTPFEEMLERFHRGVTPGGDQDSSRQRRVNGIGTGLIIDASGIIMTNHHVIAGADEVRVRAFDGREYPVAKILSDPKTDIAILSLEGAHGLKAATFGDSDESGVGEWVLALGQPFGLENSVTAGIISAKQRGIGITDRENFIQTDAAINPGNSGGPLVNLKGEVIGINTAIHSRSGGSNGIGFAVPSNLAQWVADQLLDTGSVSRAYLGIAMQPITADLAEHLGVKPSEGVMVTEVLPESPAERAGLQTGDIITHLGECKIGSPKDLQFAVEKSEPNSQKTIHVRRDGDVIQLTYIALPKPESLSSALVPAVEKVSAIHEKMIGIRVVKNTGTTENASNPGVRVVSVDKDSVAAKTGIRPEMVILRANHLILNSPEDLHQACKRAKESQSESLLLLVSFEGSRKFIVVPMS